MKLLRPLRSSPTLRLLDRLAANYLSRRGNAVLSITQAVGCRTLAHTLSEYVDKSGHLATVNGRKPHAIKRLRKALDAIAGSLRPGLTHYTADGQVQTRVAN